MKKLVVIGLLWVGGACGFSSVANADPGLLTDFGPVKVYLPFSEVNVVYNYDFIGKRNLVGGETPMFSIW